MSGDRPPPKRTVEVKAAEPVTLYATYAEGYRAPAVTETLIQGFHPPPVTGEFIPNPDLKPEVARSIGPASISTSTASSPPTTACG